MGSTPLSEGLSWVTPRSKAELLAEYEGWGPDVQTILNCMDSPSVWSIHIVDPPLETFCRGSVALLGDAVGVGILSLSLNHVLKTIRLMPCCLIMVREQGKH